MLRAMQNKGRLVREKPARQERQEREEREVLRPESGRIRKVRSLPQPGTGKFRITAREISQYFKLNEFPLAVSERSREVWADRGKFERFYLPLVATVNPASDPLVLKTLVQAKWMEMIEGRGVNPGGTRSV